MAAMFFLCCNVNNMVSLYVVPRLFGENAEIIINSIKEEKHILRRKKKEETNFIPSHGCCHDYGNDSDDCLC